MAEAAVEESRTESNKFYCHSCSEEIDPKPDFTCPKCDNGFIEELTGELAESSSPQPSQERDPAAQFTELWGRAFLESFQTQSGAGSSNNTQIGGESESDEEESRPQSRSQRPRPVTRISVRTGGPRTRQMRQPQYLHGLLQLFVDRLTGEMGQPMNFMTLHGNPADYAWGVGGLDNIITQLLNQLEGSGPAPAEKCKIDSLPTVKITQVQVDNILQCSICMEDFGLDEDAKKLPCEHHYHKVCIVTWLEMHGTCPVCRIDLNGEDSSLKNDDSLYSELQNIRSDPSEPPE
ncbi:E3 ubiquitin-protein ligase RNF115-like [Saccostrea echinata]|uniref:E3 ubiquitin-protein ligase RNF115-like n=1 Tax=Saccostrea echinata TaxID=191078 RepID=UPI002A824CFB|nr:E3 ubiquitin-protein ligase RNF115-like [Saccostrea echinata]